jgi:aminoglycoside 6'-N-acetyltransferase
VIHVCSTTFRVRFDEAGPDGRIRTSALLRYAQDLAWFHSDRMGFDRSWYRERGLTWLVRAADITVFEPMLVGTTLVGTTRVIGGRRVWARRRTDFRDAAGAIAAMLDIDWVLLDPGGAPTRIPSEFDAAFGAPKATFQLTRVALGVDPPDAARGSFVVRPQEVDPLDHANNAVYADWLEERVLATGSDPDPGDAEVAVRRIPRRIRLEYARAAPRASNVASTTWRDVFGAWSCRLTVDGADVLRARLEPTAAPLDDDSTGRVLRGEHLLLRPLRPGDRAPLQAILAEPSVGRWFGADGPSAALEGWLEADPDTTQFVIEVDGQVAGSIQFAEEDDPDYRHAGIDLFLGTEHQGKGLGPEAIRTVARHLFEDRGHHRLTIDPATANERAIAAYRRVGFRPVGVMRGYERGPDRKFHDGLLMDLLAEELS